MKSSAVWELSWALLSLLVVYLLASGAKRTVSIGALLILIPFQVVGTRFATSSVLMAYALAAILMLNGGLKFRMVPELSFIVLAYVVSTALAGREMMTWEVVTSFQFFSCLVVFLLAYNFSRLVENERTVMNVLIAMNVLTAIYCILQILAGPDSEFVPFGIEALAFNSNRSAGDPRLVGPFGTPGNTAGYLTLMTLLCAVELMFARGRRRQLMQALIAANVLGLVATANRAGMLVLLATFPAMLWLFRRELGGRRILLYAIGGTLVVSLASIVAINYTSFGSMTERLETVTETENGVPQTRAQTWPVAIEKIRRAPWFGEGPHFLTQEEAENMGILRGAFDEAGGTDTAYDPYPHSLYLYLLRTVGVFGLVAMMVFFAGAWIHFYRAVAAGNLDDYTSAMVRSGLVLIPAFLVAQITLEFNRVNSMDYAQFIFALVGLLVGLADRGWYAKQSRVLPSIGRSIRAKGPSRHDAATT